jgi:hypothetical protein
MGGIVATGRASWQWEFGAKEEAARRKPGGLERDSRTPYGQGVVVLQRKKIGGLLVGVNDQRPLAAPTVLVLL